VYNKAIVEYAYYVKDPPDDEWAYELTYIYHDNAGIILFVNERLCRIHFCFWQLLNSLKKECINCIKRCA
jgi:hypothetical protein